MNIFLRRWIFLLFLLFPIAGAALESHPPIVPQGERIDDVEQLLADILEIGSVDFLTFSPDGALLASAKGNNRVRVWDVANRREILRLETDGDKIGVAAFSPDGQMLASGSAGGAARIWRLSDGKMIQKMQWGEHDIASLAFSPDAARLAVGGAGGVCVFQINASRGPLFLPHDKTVSTLRFSLDGKTLITGAYDRALRIWNLDDGDMQGVMGPLCFHEHLKTVMKRQKGKPRQVKLMEDYCDCALSLSSTGDRLAAKRNDNSVFVWDMDSGFVGGWFDGPLNDIRGLALHPGGTLVAIETKDDGIVLQDFDSTQEPVFIRDAWPGGAFCFSPDGGTLAFGGHRRIRLWDVARRKELESITRRLSWFIGMDVGSDGKYLASVSLRRAVRVWDLKNWREVQRWDGAVGDSVCFSPDGKKLAFHLNGCRIVVADPASGATLLTINTEREIHDPLAFSPDGRIVAGAWKSTEENPGCPIVLWDAVSGEKLKELSGHEAEINSLEFSPKGQFLLSGSKDQTIRLWEVASGAERRRILPERRYFRLNIDDEYPWILACTIAAFRPNSSQFATFRPYSGVQFWRLGDDREMGRIQGVGNWMMPWIEDVRRIGHSIKWLEKAIKWIDRRRIDLYSFSFDPDGDLLATPNFTRGAIRVWDAAARRPIRLIETGTGYLRAMKFCADGKTMAFLNIWPPRYIRLVDVDSGRITGFFTANESGEWIAVDLRNSRTYRHDDGTLLQRREGARITPVPPSPATKKSALKGGGP